MADHLLDRIQQLQRVCKEFSFILLPPFSARGNIANTVHQVHGLHNIRSRGPTGSRRIRNPRLGAFVVDGIHLRDGRGGWADFLDAVY